MARASRPSGKPQKHLERVKQSGEKARKADPEKPLFVVAIGASAGGLEALDGFFRAVPGDTGMSFIVIRHLSSDHPSILPELIQRETKLPVRQAADGLRVLPDNVYIIPPGFNMYIQDAILKFEPMNGTGPGLTVLERTRFSQGERPYTST